MIYCIKDWDRHFETHKTRILKHLTFVKLPNRQDGDGYTLLLDHPNGAAHYAAWVALVLVSSRGTHPIGLCSDPALWRRKAPDIERRETPGIERRETPDLAPICHRCRGALIRDSHIGHDGASLARMTRIPAAIFDEALPRLAEIGWLEEAQLETQENQPHGVIRRSSAGKRRTLSAEERQTNAGKRRTYIEQNRTKEEDLDPEIVEGNGGVGEEGTSSLAAPAAPPAIAPLRRRPERFGTRITDDFQVSDAVRTWAKKTVPYLDLDKARDEFVDFWKAKVGIDALKLDWDATFRNRCRVLYEQGRFLVAEGRSNGNNRTGTQLSDDERARQDIAAGFRGSI